MLAVLAVSVWSFIFVVHNKDGGMQIGVAAFRVIAVLYVLFMVSSTEVESIRMNRKFIPLIERDYPGWEYKEFAS